MHRWLHRTHNFVLWSTLIYWWNYNNEAYLIMIIKSDEVCNYLLIIKIMKNVYFKFWWTEKQINVSYLIQTVSLSIATSENDENLRIKIYFRSSIFQPSGSWIAKDSRTCYLLGVNQWSILVLIISIFHTIFIFSLSTQYLKTSCVRTFLTEWASIYSFKAIFKAERD